MATVPSKSHILTLLHFARQQEREMIACLTESERNAIGTPDQWAAKDYMANILLWKELQTQKLAAVLRGETPPVWNDTKLVHQINTEGFHRFHNRRFEEIEAEGESAYEAFMAQVDRLSDEELNDPDHYAWQEGEPLRGETLRHGLWHPCNQIATFYLHSNRRNSARHLQEALLEAARQANMPPENFGIVIYNQVCFYATNGWLEKATALLPEALRLSPSLIAWSQHDPDLEGLRAERAVQAIFADPQFQTRAPAAVLISPEDLRASALGETPPFVIDVRGSAEYAAGHVLGAVNIPLNLLERRLDRIPRERLVVTYCNMHHRGESRGEHAADQLTRHGFEARVLDGGYPSWQEHGFAVEEKPKVTPAVTPARTEQKEPDAS